MNYDKIATRETIATDNRGALGHKATEQGEDRRLGWLIACGLLSVLIVLWGRGVGAQETSTTAEVSSRLAAELVRYFPAVTGEILKVEGRHIYVDLGVKDEVWTGLRLSVFRQGEALKHPTTGAVVGHDEHILGQMTLVRLSENHSVGVYIQTEDQTAEDVQPGDKVRLTAGRIRVSLLPPSGPLPTGLSPVELSEELRGALEATGRFRVEGAERVNTWLLEHGVTATAAVQAPYLQRLTKSLRTPYVVQSILKAAQGQSILALHLLAATQTEPVAIASAVLSGQAGPAVVATPPSGAPDPVPEGSNRLGGLFRQPFPTQPSGQLWNIAKGMTELHRFDDELIGFDAGDPDGDGRVEVVVATESHISLFQLSESGLQLIDTLEVSKQGRLLSAQLIRLHAGSQLGIVVNQQVDTEGIDSFVLLLQGQQLAYWQKHIYETLLAVDRDGDGINERIWGQGLDDQEFFGRDHVREYRPENGKLKVQGTLEMPYPFRATGAALVRLGSATGAVPHVVFVDERNRLRVYLDQAKLWESADFVGGSYAEARLGQNGEVDATIGKIITHAFPFEPIPEAVDVDGDGVEEALIIRNGASLAGVIPNRTRYATGDIALLKAGPYGFNLSPVSPKFDGMVSGISVVLVPTPRLLIAVSKRQGILGKKRQTLIFSSRLPLG